LSFGGIGSVEILFCENKGQKDSDTLSSAKCEKGDLYPCGMSKQDPLHKATWIGEPIQGVPLRKWLPIFGANGLHRTVNFIYCCANSTMTGLPNASPILQNQALGQKDFKIDNSKFTVI